MEPLFRGIGQGDLLEEFWIGEIAPARGDFRHAETPQRIGIVAHAEGRDDGADPPAVGVVEWLSRDGKRDAGVGEPVGMRLDYAAIHEIAGLGLGNEIERASAKKDIDARSGIRGEEGAAGRLGGSVLGRDCRGA